MDSDFDDDLPLSVLKERKERRMKKNSKSKTTPKRSSSQNGKSPRSSSSKKVRPDAVRSSSKKFRPDAVRSSSASKKRKVVPDAVTSGKRTKKANGTAAKKTPKKKEISKVDRLGNAMKAFMWWTVEDPPDGAQWSHMEHAGVSFPPPYEPHGVPLVYDGKPVQLRPVEEEAATFFAAMDPEGMHLGNPKTAPIFIKNFFADFRSVLGKGHAVKDFKKCDFSGIRQHLEEQKMIKKAVTDAEKANNKELKETTVLKFGYAIVDNHMEKVGNYNMEPPGAFRGRGEHPKMGRLKDRVDPERTILNVSQDSFVPRCPVPGRAWGEVVHDPHVMWLANWKENINGSVKYMQLAAMSSFKGKSDRSKYNKAARLCSEIDRIRKDYKKNLKSRDTAKRQLATAMWVIDRLALRVGGEKDTDEEADTVGCCSLRVEHLHFDPNGEGSDSKEIELEFLGKDSMLFKQTIDFGSELYTQDNGMGEVVYDNFVRFCKKKKRNDEVFESLNPSTLNAHLKSLMDGLTAKVFRTYNASKTLQDELAKTETELKGWKKLTPAEKVKEYNDANRTVAILCNHQKSVSKAQEATLEAVGDKLQMLKDQKKQLKGILKLLAAVSHALHLVSCVPAHHNITTCIFPARRRTK
uniref:DNA topoisomerase 1 n=1 Tax=Corethron hystrix TaxID=216773 RepID=A0A6U5F964_9STRA|mmetsp:Transcript_21933/g.49950  ORF Transcript_21933/g.49950 Transcript_21933/m.49950 type:complete len:636 (+) Transcript_21933:494-2401(+)